MADMKTDSPDETLLDTLTADFDRLKKQKSRKTGGVEGRILQNLAFVYDDHYIKYDNGTLVAEPRDDNKLYLMFNLIGPRLGKLLGRLSSISPSFKAQPSRQDPKAYAEAEVVDRLIAALDEKLVQPSRTWEILWWMAVGGVAFEHTPWIPNVSVEPVPQFSEDGSGELMYKHALTGEVVPESMKSQMEQVGMSLPEHFEVHEQIEPVGDVGSEILGPFNVFVDQSVRSIADLAPDQRVYVAKIRTVGWVEENFGVVVDASESLSLVSTVFPQQDKMSVSGSALRDLIPMIQGSAGEDDPGMVIVVEAYLPASTKNPRGRYSCFIPGQQVIHDEESPYEGVPLTDFHWKPVTTSFWTPGYIEALIPPQKFINKRLSQLGEQANATLYSTLLLGPGLSASDIPTDYPGAVKSGLDENGTPLVQRMAPPELPSWFLPSLQEVVVMFNDIAGGADLFSNDKFPGQLRGPLAVPMLQEIIDTEWGPLFFHIGERMALVKQMRLNRVKQFYPPQRTLHYTDRDQKDEVLVFHADKVLRGSLNFNVKVERGDLVPELRSLREARIKERLMGPLAILYLDERTGRLDKSKIAADLKFGEVGREDREAQYRKLGMEVVDMMWEGKPVPPVLPFYNHAVMMDELESAMATMEYLQASPQIQQAFTMRWDGHREYLIAEAQQQQAAMSNGLVQNAVAQATMQAASQAASDTVTSTRHQMGAQQMVAQGGAQGQQQAPEKPKPKKRSLTLKEEG